jgi:DNA polymerase I-like protein with 3'-5' exonuclease and polymerase domains
MLVNLITIDFETFYEKSTFSLSKLTTEEYVRSDRFEVIGVAVKVNDGETEWASGTHEQIKSWLKTYSWADSMVLAHNMMFDGLILGERFGIYPKAYADTLCMGRALHGVEVGASLGALTERYKLGVKGDEVIAASGKNREDFSEEDLSRYGDYCVNDVELTYKLFHAMLKKGFPKTEMKLIDLTLRMFVQPKLDLDLNLLEMHLVDIKAKKAELLSVAEVDKEELASNPKFAELLKSLGVEPPMKISPTTGKETFALAKNDEEFKALAEHPDVRVQALVAARLGTKSTLEETRTERFIGISKRGLMPVPLKYYAAHTGRWGGSDSVNLQNLPSRGDNAGKLKKAIKPPDGYVIIDADSSQIEARVLAWLAEQNDLVKAFKNGEDVYRIMASAIYYKKNDEITKEERFVGKTTILGAGYGMGAQKFKTQLKTFGTEVNEDQARHIIQTYRETYPNVVRLWREAQLALEALTKDSATSLGRDGVLALVPEERSIRLPSGLLLRYDGLITVRDEKGIQYQYKTRYGWNKIYGGKVIENVCQAIARCIIGEQMIRISKRYSVVLTVHDAIACIAKEEEAEEAQAYVEECMRWTPAWAEGLPVNCESGFGKNYGEC